MARPLRIEYQNACYHIINRGNRRERVFWGDDDYRLFMDKFAEFAELYDVVLYSYCLMPNHFHLQLRTRNANLGKFMQSFLTSFTLIMNHRYNKSGHLFQGRYKAQLIESELYKNKLSRYIHLNPIKIQSLKNEPLEVIRKRLQEYKWSSFRCYIGISKKPKWLNRSHVLSRWGKSATEKMSNYRKYTEEGILTDNSGELTEAEIQNIIGSDSFRDRIIKTFLKRDFKDIDGREQPDLIKINAFSVEDIILVVSNYFDLQSTQQITIRKGRDPEARRIAMYLASKHCRKKETLSSIAMEFGVKISGLNTARDKFSTRLKIDKKLKKIVSEIERKL